MLTKIHSYLVLAFLLFLSYSATAQDRLDFDQSLIGGNADTAPCVQSNFTLSGTIIGLEAGYEWKLGRLWSLMGRAGYHNGLIGVRHTEGPDYYETVWNFSPRPTISLETRHYVSMDRRAARGKRTDLNSANYIAIRPSVYLLPRNNDFFCIDMKAMYGIRRVYGKSFFTEYNFGLGYSSFSNNHPIYPLLNLRLGFAF